MNRTMRTATLALMAASGLASLGCMGTRPGIEGRYNNLVDPCWPERYSYLARESVLYPFEQQANNASVIDQTIWNYHFEPGTAKLSPAGREKLDNIARRRSCQDGRLYLQTARDLVYDERNPDKLVTDRARLDIERGQAVLAYMSTQPTARMINYDITPIDPMDPGVNSAGPATSVRGLPSQYRSTLTGAVGSGLTGTGGGVAPGTPTGAPAGGGAGAAPAGGGAPAPGR